MLTLTGAVAPPGRTRLHEHLLPGSRHRRCADSCLLWHACNRQEAESPLDTRYKALCPEIQSGYNSLTEGTEWRTSQPRGGLEYYNTLPARSRVRNIQKWNCGEGGGPQQEAELKSQQKTENNRKMIKNFILQSSPSPLQPHARQS